MAFEDAAVLRDGVERLSLLRLFGRTMRASALYAPLAIVLALLGAAVLINSLIHAVEMAAPSHGLSISRALLSLWLIAWPVLGHALFISFLTALIGLSPLPLGMRLREAVRFGLRGLPLTGALVLAIIGAAFVSPYLSIGLWALACFTAAPAHFARFGWRALWTAPRTPAASAVSRLVVLVPSALFLSALTWLLSSPGLSWGFMQGGIVLAALASLGTFWLSFSCALFSAEFARPCPGPRGTASGGGGLDSREGMARGESNDGRSPRPWSGNRP
jgi:hypothetical protein